MNKKILIIGQKGLLGSNLFKFFKTKKIKVYTLDFESFLKYQNKNINKFDIIINCTSNKKFNQIVFELIKKNSFGTFNVSLGKKIYINQLITWLNFYNSMKIRIINPKNSFNNDNFTLNNKKLMHKIKIKNDVIDLKNECLKISKNFFKKKNK